MNTYGYVEGNPIHLIDQFGLFGFLLNEFKKGPYKVPRNDMAAISELSSKLITTGATAAVAGPYVIGVGGKVVVGTATLTATGVKSCSSKVAKHKDKLCKTGVLAGSLLCFDKDGKWDPQDDVANTLRNFEKITNQSNKPKIPYTHLPK